MAERAGKIVGFSLGLVLGAVLLYRRQARKGAPGHLALQRLPSRLMFVVLVGTGPVFVASFSPALDLTVALFELPLVLAFTVHMIRWRHMSRRSGRTLLHARTKRWRRVGGLRSLPLGALAAWELAEGWGEWRIGNV